MSQRPSPVIFKASSTTYQKSNTLETFLNEQKHRQQIAREAHEKDITSIQTTMPSIEFPPFFFTEWSDKKLV